MNTVSEEILLRPVQFLKSVGPKRAEAFGKIGIHTIKDMLFYFPTRHLDRTNILSSVKAYHHLQNGYEGEVTIIAKVYEKEKIRPGKKEILKIQFRDESGFFECVWFQGAKYFYTSFNEGDILAISGKPTISKYGGMQFAHPDYDRISEEESSGLINTGKIIPFYRIPKELKKS